MNDLSDYLKASQSRHSHLCPRQVLGVRIALAGLKWLDIEWRTKQRKKILVIAETNGCFVDGIEVTAQVSVGHRTLQVEDYGKIAATFVDLRTNRAIRLRPVINVRERARAYYPLEKRAYFSQLKGYQAMPDWELLSAEWVALDQDVRQMIGSPRQRACCSACGEEIINGREVANGEIALCMPCAGQGYYHSTGKTSRAENSSKPDLVVSPSE